ncbi:hypothetical protein BVRB_6g141800 [Beta vulgaris subsp. vulgaris]|uniref:Uncharacterized protein n=1 Tax=Beta vulgaris subsp. vulgaris TaxID=3555 RepID=A0A0J8C8H1_BETVV|nr:hypothetical protein BVRB_6g141800 [Beta vulgaris subsp. vulgaris]
MKNWKKKNKKQKKRGQKVVEELVKPVVRVTRTSQRVRNLKVLNSPSHDEEESDDDDEVSVIAKEVYDACIPSLREHSPVPMDTIPPTTSSPPKSASPPPFAPQNTPIPPYTKSPPSPVPKDKKPAAVPIPEEQPAIPNLKEQPAAQNPPNTSPSSSQNPTIGATYTLAHSRRLDYLFTLVMGHSEAMLEFANEAKGVNGLVHGLMSKVDKALEGQKLIIEQPGDMTTSLQMMNSRLMKLEGDELKLDQTVAGNHKEVMTKLDDVVEEVVEQPSSPKP